MDYQLDLNGRVFRIRQAGALWSVYERDVCLAFDVATRWDAENIAHRLAYTDDDDDFPTAALSVVTAGIVASIMDNTSDDSDDFTPGGGSFGGGGSDGEW